MKLATYRDGSRDGQLVVVSRDLKLGVFASGVANTLQRVMDDWAFFSPQLEDIYRDLNTGRAKNTFAFDPGECMSPLPRAYQWADGSAYVNHVELVRKARGATMPESFWHDPLIYQGGSDDFIGPREDIALGSESWGIDFEGEVAVIADDVVMGATRDQALAAIRLIMLCNDVSLRELIPAELAKGFGFYQGKPASSFSPVAVTPDELGSAWSEGKLHLPLIVTHNGRVVGRPNAGVDMVFDFGTLISHATKTRRARAGAIFGSGTVSNRDANVDPSVGYACIAEKRCLETIADGKPATPFMVFGDQIRLEMCDADGRSIFGAIDQKVVPLSP